jgi:hypothetical protein
MSGAVTALFFRFPPHVFVAVTTSSFNNHHDTLLHPPIAGHWPCQRTELGSFFTNDGT